MPSFDYTSRDYLSIRQDLFDRASAFIPEWTARNPSDFGVLMVDLVAYVGDILHYYVDRAAAETYLNTATQKSSVLAIANLLDYRPLFQTASEGTVTLTATDPNHAGVITIPKNTMFVAPATSNLPVVYFATTASASMGASVASIEVVVSEGKYVNLEAPVQSVTRVSSSNGTSGQRFNLRYTGAIGSSVEVSVYEGTVVSGSPTAITYSYSSDIASEDAAARVFTLEVTSDGVMQVIFGNGINGKIPANNAEIKVSYRYGQGYAGNISSGRITAFDTGSAIEGLIISSSSSTAGGSDSESLESMKANIPLMFRTQDRAVSLQDFKDLAIRVPQVAKATCSNAGSNVMVFGVPYQPNYLAQATNSLAISSTIQNAIITYFTPRTMVGASVGAAASVTLQPVNITATINVKPQYVAQLVKEDVETELNKFFTFDNVSFGQILSIGSIYRAIQNVEGVDYATISVFSVTSSGTSSTLTPATATQLFRKGTFTLTTSGGITGTLV
jgi:predicted phage baseplate assembly protein